MNLSRWIIAGVIIGFLASGGWKKLAAPFLAPETATAAPAVATEQAITEAYARQQSNVQVQGQGVVTRILPDDTKGSRHQRFILRLATGQTLLIAHNIDLASRLNGLKEGDQVAFYGEYEWNDKGGVVHWTHHDPQGRHTNGWLELNGVKYQ
ncbi:DUF3465 domain-containing protein [Pokkaliibacter sp. CJK22405]|uniref:DUF3465 domain-containing protein n=1 Tax=Pokkaliibacter sp. CJK22405 TaxID=3384615 RepID=UPI0039851079